MRRVVFFELLLTLRDRLKPDLAYGFPQIEEWYGRCPATYVEAMEFIRREVKLFCRIDREVRLFDT